MADQTEIQPQSSVVGASESPLNATVEISVPPLAYPTTNGPANRPWVSIALMVVVGLVRLVSIPLPNFVPIGALALFGGGRLRSWRAFAVPIVVMLATDGLLTFLKPYSAFYSGQQWVYGSILIYVLVGRWLCQGNSPVRIGLAALLGAVQFFLITNFGVWATGGEGGYPHTLAGLVACYDAGIPFFRYGTLPADLFYSGVLFGGYALATRLIPAPKARLAS